MKAKTALAVLAALVMGNSLVLADSSVPKSYPLKKCVVSDEPLGDHGKAIKVTGPDGTAVYLCCDSCIKDFKKNPAKYTKMVHDAEQKKGKKK